MVPSTFLSNAGLSPGRRPGVSDTGAASDYVQLPLQAQLRSGVRSIETDLRPDPEGGALTDPFPWRQLREQGVTNLAPIYRDELARPGMKVFHLADMDFRSQCPKFRSCLTLLRQWSGATPGHSPVFVLPEPNPALAPPLAVERYRALEPHLIDGVTLAQLARGGVPLLDWSEPL